MALSVDYLNCLLASIHLFDVFASIRSAKNLDHVFITIIVFPLNQVEEKVFAIAKAITCR